MHQTNEINPFVYNIMREKLYILICINHVFFDRFTVCFCKIGISVNKLFSYVFVSTVWMGHGKFISIENENIFTCCQNMNFAYVLNKP